jgi:uncharacterized OB-fold protein
MTLSRCIGCGRWYVTAPAFCRCGGGEFAPGLASGRGRVYSCTTLYAAAEAHEKDLPFQIAIIELEEGARLTARITGPAVAIGDAVELAGESDGVYRFGAAA